MNFWPETQQNNFRWPELDKFKLDLKHLLMQLWNIVYPELQC